MSASTGVGTLLSSGLLPTKAFGETWLTWWLGDSIGILVITPLLLVIARPFSNKMNPYLIIEPILMVVLTIVISSYVFIGLPKPLVFLTFPLLVWAALKFEEKGAVFSIFIISLISNWATIKGLGPFSTIPVTNESLLFVQTFIGVAAPMALILAVNLSEKRRINETLKIREEEVAMYSRDLENRIKERTLELQKSNESLEDFASIASHDLQEPLRKIAIFGDRLKTKLTNAGEEEIDIINRMRRATLRMQSLIVDLLGYSKVSSPISNLRTTNLDTLVREVLSDLDTSIQSTQAEIHIGPLPKLEADPTQMRQLFQNLISNAIKYHKAGVAPKIRIESNKFDNEDWEISVSDNGIGFEEKYSKRIYKPFERLHGIDAYQGTGMGLAICQKIVSNHGGKISTQSEPGKGSTFTILLPHQKLKTDLQLEKV